MTDTDHLEPTEEPTEPHGEAASQVSEPESEFPREGAYRRAPRYGRFILAGILLGGIVSFVIVLATGHNAEITPGSLYAILMLWLVPIGILCGSLTAFLLDRRSIKRADRQSPSEG